LRDQEPIDSADWTKAAPYAVVFAVGSIGGPNVALSDKSSPYRFTAKQVGRYTAGH